jgi:hypothetical protein
MMKHIILGSMTIWVVGCSDFDKGPTFYSQEVLDEYLKAIPTNEDISVLLPEGFEVTRSFGDPALFPATAISSAGWTNSAVQASLTNLSHFTEQEPSAYSEENQIFTWGPSNHHSVDEFGQMRFTIHKSDSSFFQYEYVLYRLLEDDPTTQVPVMWGGSNPNDGDIDDQRGILLWDMDANQNFGVTHKDIARQTIPDYTTALLPRGRFAVTYGHTALVDESETSVRPVYSIFDHYQEDADAETVNLEFVYGRVDGEQDIKFLDFTIDTHMNIPGYSNDSQERVDVSMAFIDSGEGRAECQISEGDVGEETLDCIECWNEEIKQHYWSITDTSSEIESSGAPENCGPATESGPLFNTSLDELNFPEKEDVDPEYVTLIECLVVSGFGNCD